MARMDPDQARSYLAGLKLANEFELEELRKAPVELKLRQLWTMMTSAGLFENDSQREAGVREVQDRWARIHRAVHA